jgi:integrase
VAVSESSQPFTEAELRLILRVADDTPHRLVHQGWDREFIGRLMRVYLYLGIHPSVLCGMPARRSEGDRRRVLPALEPLSSANIVKQIAAAGDEYYLEWKRVKTGRPVLVPIPDAMRPWLRVFLDSPKPERRQSYNRILKKIEAGLLQAGYRIKVTPRRCRHTCAVQLLKTGRMLAPDVENYLSISPGVLKVYANRPREEIAADLRRSGWGNA